MDRFNLASQEPFHAQPLRWRGTEEFLLFLDFDGVLHPEAWPLERQFSRAPLLAEALEPFPGVGVVVSSAWRSSPGHLFWPHLPESLRDRIIGGTPESVSGFGPGGRSREIEAFLDACGWQGPWLALDDRSDLFEPRHHERCLFLSASEAFGPQSAGPLGSLIRRGLAR